MLEKKIEMETMEDYHELYLKFDVLFLADVFEKIRNDSLENCGLCPSHYLIAPGLSWDAMLKIEKLKKKKKAWTYFRPWHKRIFFEEATRGGISYISSRYSKANNKYLTSHDQREELKHYISRCK